MRPIPPKLRQHLSTLPRMSICARYSEGGCSGRVEWHHAIKERGRQVNEEWAILGGCHRHHVGDLKNDEAFRHHAYQLILDEDLLKRKLGTMYLQEKSYLAKKYGSGKI